MVPKSREIQQTNRQQQKNEKKNCQIKSESTVSKHALTYTDNLEFWNCAIAQKIARGWPIYENHLKNCTISLSVDFFLATSIIRLLFLLLFILLFFLSFSLSVNFICWQFGVDVLSMKQHFFFQIDADY